METVTSSVFLMKYTQLIRKHRCRIASNCIFTLSCFQLTFQWLRRGGGEGGYDSLVNWHFIGSDKYVNVTCTCVNRMNTQQHDSSIYKMHKRCMYNPIIQNVTKRKAFNLKNVLRTLQVITYTIHNVPYTKSDYSNT